MHYGATRQFFTSTGKSIKVFRAPESSLRRELGKRWVVSGIPSIKVYQTKHEVAKLIMQYRLPGQITGLSMMNLLVSTWG